MVLANNAKSHANTLRVRRALCAMEEPVKNSDNSDNSDRTLADVEKTFYEAMSKNTVFSSVNKSASALEKLAVNTEALTKEIENANESSTKLTTSLNRLTLAAVVIAGLALILEVVKMCLVK
jgi:uncharacterized phage infection (PIP) family protein YhgE